jgi:hypothetical protein
MRGVADGGMGFLPSNCAAFQLGRIEFIRYCKKEKEGDVMEKIILDPVQQSQLVGINQQVPVCDQAGKVLGFFLSPALYKKLVYKDVTVPFSDEELQQFRQSGDGSSLAEFWQTMGAQ